MGLGNWDLIWLSRHRFIHGIDLPKLVYFVILKLLKRRAVQIIGAESWSIDVGSGNFVALEKVGCFISIESV